MTNRKLVLDIEINGKQGKAQLREFANEADKAFRTRSAKNLATQIGLTSGVTTALTTAFIDMAAEGVKAFLSIANEAVELNKEAELTRISLTQVFGGNEKAADAFIDQIKEVSVLLGVSRGELTGLAKGILPDVGNVDTTLDIVKNITILGKDAAQSIQSIRIAAEEALSGNLSSLQRRLNIPQSTIASIERYAETMEFADAVARGLSEQVTKTGLSAEATADSLSTVQGQLQGQLEDLQRLGGQSSAEELKEQFKEISAAIAETNPELEDAVQALGDMAAQAIELVGSGIVDFIENVDAEGIEEFADSMSDVLATGQLLLDTLDIPDAFNSLISGASNLLGTLERALFTAAQLNVIVSSKAAGLEARIKKQIELGILDERGRTRRAVTEEDQVAIDAAEEAARRAEIEKGLVAFKEHSEQIEENRRQTEDRSKVVEKATEDDLAQGEAYLAQQKALRQLTEAEEDAAKAQDKITEATEKANKAREDADLELEIRQQNRLIDLLIDNARAREDIARANAQAVADINRKNAQDIEDSVKDLSREEADIARDGARRQRQIATDEANERLSIERDFRQQLEQIQRTFQQSALEAERANDVQAFLSAVRTRDNAITDARSNRDTGIADTRTEAEQQRQALKSELQNEIADTKSANAAKLESLRDRLARELEDQAIKNQRELEEQAITEQRKEEDRLARDAREIADLERKFARKQEALQKSLADEFALIEAAEMAKTQLLIEQEAQRLEVAKKAAEDRQKLQQAINKSRQTQTRKQSGLNVRGGIPVEADAPDTQIFLPLVARARGGPLNAGQSALVGERGPEIFTPNVAGNITPNHQIFSPPALPSLGNVTNTNTTNNNSPSFQLSQSMLDDPIQRRQLEMLILQVMS